VLLLPLLLLSLVPPVVLLLLRSLLPFQLTLSLKLPLPPPSPSLLPVLPLPLVLPVLPLLLRLPLLRLVLFLGVDGRRLELLGLPVCTCWQDAAGAASAGSAVEVTAAAGLNVMVIFKLRAESLLNLIHVGHFRYCMSSTPACSALTGDIITE
jgi:hypothetical protein